MCTAGNKYRPNETEICTCGNLRHEIWSLKCDQKADRKKIEQLQSSLDKLNEKHRFLVNAVIDFITEHTTDLELVDVMDAWDLGKVFEYVNDLMEELDEALTSIESERDSDATNTL